MKKIFAISLIAMSAVTAANAEIASKAYVDQREEAIEGHIGALSGLSNGITNTSVVAAINSVASTASSGTTSAIEALNGTTTSGDVSIANGSNVVREVTETNGVVTVTHGKVLDSVANSASSGTGNVITGISVNSDGKTLDYQMGISAQEVGNMITGTETTGANAIDQTATDKYPSMATAAAIAAAAVSDAGVGTQITTAINALDAADTKGSQVGNVVTLVSEADGVVSATYGNVLDAVADGTTYETGDSAANKVVVGITENSDGKTINYTMGDPLTTAAYSLQTSGTGAGKYVLTAVYDGNTLTGYEWELIQRAQQQ